MAEAWASKNAWFGKDRAMTYTAFEIHKDLVEKEGYDSNSDEYYAEIDKRIRVDVWGGSRKELACLRTVTAHIENMIKGLTKGFKYKMRFVYAHFPINGTIVGADDSPSFEIRNFLGEKRVRVVKARPGVTMVKSTDVKDEIQVSGSDLNAVSLTCSDISSVTKVRKKDIRKFLDGIYVSEKGFIEESD